MPLFTRHFVQSLTCLLLVGCGGSAVPADSASADAAAPAGMTLDPALACEALRPLPPSIAVLDFIEHAVPKPLRFLNAVSTDSALPPAAELAVQKKGPTFYWLESERNQQQIREKLAGDGPWETLLVLMRENTDHADGTHTLRVGGRYVGASNDGDESPEKRYTIACQVDSVAAWVITRIDSGAPR